MLDQLRNWTACERGNTLLTSLDSGDFTSYMELPGGGYLEIDFRHANYPALNVATLDITPDALLKHIHTRLFGWYVSKGNLDGLRIDEGGCVASPVKEHYLNEECPDCGEPIPDDAVPGGECVNCGHVWWNPTENA